MRPGTRHRFSNLCRIQIREDLLDATQLGDGVDAMCSQRLNQLILVVLWRPSANSPLEDE